ncbi:hypothetical protein EZV62_024269 [Acer yangbiense]|uniref:Pyruvate kinase n=1 Tax=Acer yangbiense TaxID=1000413 RepID=A0A5C7H507_9ROSI|nr:hypothetical protein EZV62_024269 [Acer yangbiense]
MIKSPWPTCAKATNVADVVLDGTNCVMLSGESVVGAYQELAAKIMHRICINAGSSLDYGAIFKEMIRSTTLPMSPLESLASSTVRIANKAKLVAKYRPAIPILSVATNAEVIVEAAMKSATEKGLCQPSDAAVAFHNIEAAYVNKICIVK